MLTSSTYDWKWQRKSDHHQRPHGHRVAGEFVGNGPIIAPESTLKYRHHIQLDDGEKHRNCKREKETEANELTGDFIIWTEENKVQYYMVTHSHQHHHSPGSHQLLTEIK